jgi:hypothetical protein
MGAGLAWRGAVLFAQFNQPQTMTVFSTHHTYPDITQGGRLVRVSWDTSTIERAIMATLRTSPEAVILQVTIDGKLAAQGLMPAGLG